MIKQILDDLVASVNGAQSAIFLDGDGETISQSGDRDLDVQMIGAWDEIQLDRIRDICKGLRLGKVHAVMFSLDKRNELMIPVADEYCLLLVLSTCATIQESLYRAGGTIEQLKGELG